MKKQAVLFDLDGTLLNTLNDIGRSMNSALALHGLPGHAMDKYRYFVGNGAVNLTLRALGDRADLLDAVYADYRRIYSRDCRIQTQPYAGVPDMLAALAARGARLCVFSNKDQNDVESVVREYFPNVRFEDVRGRVPNVAIKPAPDGALLAARTLGVAPEDFFYLGDTATDMECAKNAGMTAVGAAWGFRTREELSQSGARHILSAPEEMLALWDGDENA